MSLKSVIVFHLLKNISYLQKNLVLFPRRCVNEIQYSAKRAFYAMLGCAGDFAPSKYDHPIKENLTIK